MAGALGSVSEFSFFIFIFELFACCFMALGVILRRLGVGPSIEQAAMFGESTGACLRRHTVCRRIGGWVEWVGGWNGWVLGTCATDASRNQRVCLNLCWNIVGDGISFQHTHTHTHTHTHRATAGTYERTNTDEIIVGERPVLQRAPIDALVMLLFRSLRVRPRGCRLTLT